MDTTAKVSIIPLGGLAENGKNMTVIKYERDLLVIDCGMMIPQDEMLGIDVVIPDITFLQENKDGIKGMILTHGHEDHIGALPYVLRELQVPVYGTKLTLALAQSQLEEHGVQVQSKFQVVKPREKVKIGQFMVEFIRVSHSMPDCVAVAIHTPVGTLIHTSDFKFDQTPPSGQGTDYFKLAQLGEQGVLLLMSDSTNAEKNGFSQSEKLGTKTIEEAFRTCRGRITVANFSTNIYRIQQTIALASRYRRKVSLVGKLTQDIVKIAHQSGFLNIPKGVILEEEAIANFPREKLVLLTTGYQGEALPVYFRPLAKESNINDYRKGDAVVLTANQGGHEKLVSRSIDALSKLGVDVYYERNMGTEVHDHGNREELKLMLNLTRPKYFLPIQGEYRRMILHAKLASEIGIPEENIFIAENGHVLDFTKTRGVLAGKVTAGHVLVDGLGVGDVGNIVLRDRRQLSQDGILIVVVTMSKQTGQIMAGPDVVSRGFVYVREAEVLMEEVKERVRQVLSKGEDRRTADWATIKTNVRDVLSKFLYEKTKRRPMILPIVMEK